MVPSRSKRLDRLRQAHAQALSNWERLLTGSVAPEAYKRAFGGRDSGGGGGGDASRSGYADAEAIVTDRERGVGILQLIVERKFRALIADAPEASAALIADVVKAFRSAISVRRRAQRVAPWCEGGFARGRALTCPPPSAPPNSQAEFETLVSERHLAEKFEALERLEAEHAAGADGR